MRRNPRAFVKRRIRRVQVAPQPLAAPALFVGVLIALGVGIYQVEPPAPMCEIDSGDVVLVPNCFPDGGRRFVTWPAWNGVGRDWRGPLQAWDCRTGAEICRHFDKGQVLRGPVFSKNGRRLCR